MNETDGKETVSKVGYLFDNPASFRKLEIEPNAFLNSDGRGAPWYEGVQGQGIGERLEFSFKKNNSYAEVFGKQKIFISIGYVDYSRPDLYNANSRPKILYCLR